MRLKNWIVNFLRFVSFYLGRLRFRHSRFHRRGIVDRRKRRRRLALGVGIAILIYMFVGGDYGIYKIWRQKRRITQLEREIEVLKVENVRLEREVSLLERDLSYVEKIARERYGMVKEGEIVYKVSK